MSTDWAITQYRPWSWLAIDPVDAQKVDLLVGDAVHVLATRSPRRRLGPPARPRQSGSSTNRRSRARGWGIVSTSVSTAALTGNDVEVQGAWSPALDPLSALAGLDGLPVGRAGRIGESGDSRTTTALRNGSCSGPPTGAVS